ncbi:MAG: hypothetical protein K6G36_03185 [Candidatus Saccharibacteria bacterium]|nr:hypothetical protein [Candidatus Saccharibacteria bacterium]
MKKSVLSDRVYLLLFFMIVFFYFTERHLLLLGEYSYAQHVCALGVVTAVVITILMFGKFQEVGVSFGVAVCGYSMAPMVVFSSFSVGLGSFLIIVFTLVGLIGHIAFISNPPGKELIPEGV